jgi:hypothetical protein
MVMARLGQRELTRMTTSALHTDLILKTATLCVAFFGFALTIVTLYFNYQRGRRELAVRLMIDWANNSDVATKYCMRLAADLSDSDVTSVWERKKVKISDTHLDLVRQLLIEGFDQDDLSKLRSDGTGSVTIESLYVEFIHYHWTRYLNRLESTLAAWDSHVANEAMMERQFGKLLSDRENLLRKLTKLDPAARNGACFPTVEKFLQKIDARQSLPKHGSLLSGALAIVLAAAAVFAYFLWIALRGAFTS